MLQMPHRSVTRFFIPLIDVLTLLFAVFLIMPLAHEAGDDNPELANQTAEERADYLRQENKRLKDEAVRMRKDQRESLQTPPKPRILEIDAKSGKLYDSDAERTEIRDKVQARTLIDRDQRRGGQKGWKLYYTILYPRERSSDRPSRRQRELYEDWFQGVPMEFDIPGDPGK